MLLLDTHAWVWSVAGDTRRIGRRARQLLARAEIADAIRISPVSIFEVTALHTLGRLQLATPAEQWIGMALDRPGVRVLDLTPGIAIDAGHLPRTSLADPIDRLLVATARRLGATFLTSDAPILEYASRTGSVRTHDASR